MPVTSSKSTLLAIAIALVACSRTDTPKPGEPVAARSDQAVHRAEQMTFGWPETGVVHVTEFAEKKGVKAEIVYELHICKAERGRQITYRNFRFVTLDGVPADDDRIKDQVKQALVFARLIPVLWVGDDGRLIDLIGMQEMIRRVTVGVSDVKARAAMEQFAADPKMVAMIKAKSSEVWSAWVGAWVLFEPAGDAKQSFVVEIPLPSGKTERQIVIERVAEKGDLLRLRMKKTEGNQELKSTLIQIMQPLLTTAPTPAKAQEMLRAADIERVTIWEVLTDPGTLRPTEAETKMTIVLSLPGQAPKSRFEHHRYAFDWATGASTAPQCGS